MKRPHERAPFCKAPSFVVQFSRCRFARCYFSTGASVLRGADAAHTFAFSIIMLNTDQHNPQVARVSVDVLGVSRTI